MKAGDRRAVLARLAMLGLAPLVMGLSRRAGAQAPAVHAAPQGTFDLTRTLERQLGDSGQLRVVRSWRCTFRQAATCIAVTGAQKSCAVDAPPALAALAAVERARVSNLFPLELDAAGLICAALPVSADRDLEVAANAARLMLKDAGPGSGSFVATLAQTASRLVSVVPDDLFYPHGAGASVDRAVPLGDEGEGRIRVTFAAQVREADGLLLRSEKQVTTTLHGISRMASERWSLTAV